MVAQERLQSFPIILTISRQRKVKLVKKLKYSYVRKFDIKFWQFNYYREVYWGNSLWTHRISFNESCFLSSQLTLVLNWSEISIISVFSVVLLHQADYCPIYLQIGNLLQNIENLFLFQQSNTGYSKSRSLRFTNENVFFCTLKESPVPPFMLCYSQFCPISVVL